MNKKDNLTLAQRLRQLFAGEKLPARVQPAAISQPAPAHHAQSDMAFKAHAFKAGAAVAFITPIGAYAGNTSQQSERMRAEQQFRHLETSPHTTIN